MEDVKAIAEQVKKILQDDAMNARKEQELQKINDQIEQIEKDSNLKDVEREMHMSVLAFKKKRTEMAYTDLEKAKKFAEFENKYNTDNELNVIRINPKGDTVIELYVPKAALSNFDELLIASTAYWKALTDKIDSTDE